MTVFVPESIHILGTDGGGLSVVLCSMYVDTLADLPAPTAYTGYRLSMGCTARVIADNSRHRINSSGQWVDITENDGKYTLPPATSNSLGGIMVGSGLTIDSAGMLSGDFSALWDSIYQTEKHLTGVTPLSFMASGNGIEAAVIYGNGQQTGTPSPQNIIMPEFVGKRTANLLDYTTVESTTNATATQISGGISVSGKYFVKFTSVNFTIGNTYTMSWQANTTSGTSAPAWRFHYADNTYSSMPSSGGRIVAEKEVSELLLYVSTAKSCTVEFTNIMLNAGNTALPYEPFGWAEKITCAGQTVPVYLGQTQTVRRVKKLVLTGNENWTSVSVIGGLAFLHYPTYATKDANGSNVLSTHYKPQYSDNDGNIYITNHRIVIVDFSFDSVDAFKAYLAAQYAAGTPVTVWYVLAEPEAAIVNEPLCKIGDYADELSSTDAGVTIPTAKGSNTLTVDTPLQPSKISITYF